MNGFSPAAQRTLLLLVCVAACAGCGQSGPPTYSVSGVVEYQGRPLPAGSVMFVPETGPAQIAPIGPGGEYTIETIAGPHRIGVRSTARRAPSLASFSEHAPPPAEPAVPIPAHFERYDTSGLIVEVAPRPDNHFRLTLKAE